jgi:hypothetical protein
MAINDRSYELHLFSATLTSRNANSKPRLASDAAALLSPRSSAPAVSQARVYLAMNDLARAQQKVDARHGSSQTAVNSPWFGIDLGSNGRGAGRWRNTTRRSLEWFRHAGARQPGQPRDARATYEIAKPHIERLLAMGYRPARMHFGLAQIAEARADTKTAITEYREALRLEPGLAEAKTALTRLGGQP